MGTDHFSGELLEANANKVSYVGTSFNGDMTNNAVEAISGYTIGMMDAQAESSGAWDYLPNVVLVFLGTNDCDQPLHNAANGPPAMKTLLQHIRQHSPMALTLVAGVIHNLDTTRDACTKDLNNKLGQIVAAAASDGQNIKFVNMYDTVPLNYLDASDETHPHDPGYRPIAQKWYKTLVKYGSAISAPDPQGKAPPASGGTGGHVGGETCEKKDARVRGPVKIAKGSGWDDGHYSHSSTSLGRVFDGPAGVDGSAVVFADLDGDGLDNYIMFNDTHMGVAMGLGASKFGLYLVYEQSKCKQRGVSFRDGNGDKKADMLCELAAVPTFGDED
ncbi:hypothetical protein LTR53_007021 [Teratosphaeriaceae sp. CCFEE 6253]|nr:hypothetical protein LTR53_007021 [Teratosphaeriaceae sp. CCFEE 6253]